MSKTSKRGKASAENGGSRSQQRLVGQATSAQLEYELLCRAVERGHEQIARATETLAVLQDKQTLRLLEQQTQKRRLSNIRS